MTIVKSNETRRCYKCKILMTIIDNQPTTTTFFCTTCKARETVTLPFCGGLL